MSRKRSASELNDVAAQSYKKKVNDILSNKNMTKSRVFEGNQDFQQARAAYEVALMDPRANIDHATETYINAIETACLQYNKDAPQIMKNPKQEANEIKEAVKELQQDYNRTVVFNNSFKDHFGKKRKRSHSEGGRSRNMKGLSKKRASTKKRSYTPMNI